MSSRSPEEVVGEAEEFLDRRRIAREIAEFYPRSLTFTSEGQKRVDVEVFIVDDVEELRSEEDEQIGWALWSSVDSSWIGGGIPLLSVAEEIIEEGVEDWAEPVSLEELGEGIIPQIGDIAIIEKFGNLAELGKRIFLLQNEEVQTLQGVGGLVNDERFRALLFFKSIAK